MGERCQPAGLAANDSSSPKIGDVKIVYHRPLEGTPKTDTIRRTATGKWFVTIACEWEPTPLPPTCKEVGIDVGLKTFATLSDGQEIANPRFFRQEEHALAKAQQKHQAALDTDMAIRTEVTKQVQEAKRDVDEQAGRVAGGEPESRQRAAWKVRQRRRKVVARTHERTRWKRDDFAHQHSRRIVDAFAVIVVETSPSEP